MLMRSFFSTFEEISLFFRCRQIKTLISLFWEFWNHVRLSLLSLTNTVFSIFFPSLFFSDGLYIKKHLGSFRSRRVIMSSLNTKATDAEIVNGIKGSSILFITIWSIGMFFFGLIGHALSIYVFTRRSLRSNPCAQYFLGSAITGLGVVLTNVPLRFLQRAYRIDVFVTSNEMCRIMSWILFSIRYQQCFCWTRTDRCFFILLGLYLHGLLHWLVLIGKCHNCLIWE